jgi:hypothetical protein
MSWFKTNKGTELPLLDLRGKPYLQVAHRVVWFREDHPMGKIVTDIVQTNNDCTTAKATIHSETGEILATAHKTEHRQHFADHLEKAETGAIGRALALCGYGTQFAPEFDEKDRLADTPVAQQRPAQTQSRPPEAKIAKDPGEYVINFGKRKGQKINKVPVEELEKYKDWLIDSSKKDGKPLSANAAEFIANFDAFVGEAVDVEFNNQQLGSDIPF